MVRTSYWKETIATNNKNAPILVRDWCTTYPDQHQSYQHHLPLHLEDARFIVCEDEREVIVTYVSTCSLQRQSHKGKLNSN